MEQQTAGFFGDEPRQQQQQLRQGPQQQGGVVASAQMVAGQPGTATPKQATPKPLFSDWASI